VNQGRPDISGQRQSFQPLTLAAHNHLAVLPVQVVQGHRQDFPTAQTQSSQQQQDGVVTLAGRRAAITAAQQSRDLFRR
jgi:hypothetical protein